MKQYDVIFIGSGHAAWHAAVALTQRKMSVALIEKDTLAGTCTNFGCNPKFLLESPFEVLDDIERLDSIFEQKPDVSWENLMAYKHEVINPQKDSLGDLFNQMGVDIIKGFGKIKDKNTVTVDGTDYGAKYIVIATGQRSHVLDIEGKEYLHDSRDFMDLETFPERITFIGGGYISIEFATIASKLGANVHVISHSDQILKAFHQPYVEKLIKKLEEENVTFHYNEDVNKVEEGPNGLKLTAQSGFTLETDYIVDATGRIPNVENMGLDELGIKYSDKGIKVNKQLLTNVDNIYASGDVLDKKIPKLTPTASFESNYIALQIMAREAKLLNPLKALELVPIKYPVIPTVAYTLPRLSQVGLSIAEAEKKGYDIKTIEFGKQLRFQYKNETDAEMVIALDKKKRIAGAAIYAHQAADLINIMTFIVEKKLTAKDLNLMIFAFPSESSGILDLLKVQMLGIDMEL
ncbi:NAD(P)/FAD-dependent oxidoreductase [Macrococcus hajekii]|uniref:NAD(P)/FAD-dependent oxidoreductase n=1 Tax=Macrococcus hajekii TaxID=198482 RepID=A0A4R6BLQ6_9STAP|nr:NAD(P)/FAD-dependent oxidoreductase [Macrococcus hajekii]TDM02734.1 NAD(P)/FAD-dependent oxidoreductase [Macrococcus hajekii]GGB03436.1 dihydrolipoamide dehydrogenase [Macrococcus hajekii]